jgi:hypothetical protein
MSISISSDDDLIYARPAARDAFLNALDSDDRDALTRLARELTHCSNPLPGVTRDELGLPAGATYGAAARHILACATAEQPASPVASSSVK